MNSISDVVTKIALRTIVVLVIFFVLLFAFTKIAGPFPFNINSVQTNKNDTFYVNGEGKVSVRPDTGVVTLGVRATGQTAVQVQTQLNDAMNKVTGAIKGLGVNDQDIETENYSINPEYDFRPTGPGTQRITGYTANSNLVVKVRDINQVNSVLDIATAQGANQIGGVTFELSDKAKAQDEARKEAVAQAKQKAVQAASTVGFKLGKLVNYSEDFGDAQLFYSQDARSSTGIGASEATTSAPATQVEPGSTDIRVIVTLNYEIY